MFRQAFSFGGLLLLAGAVVLATPGLGQAQHGGGHGGGGRGGGGFHSGGFNNGGSFHSGTRFGSFPSSRSFAYPYYGYYPYYGSYGYTYPYYYGTSPTYDSGYSSGDPAVYPPSAFGYQSTYPPATTPAEPDTRALVTVGVPADARIWFEDKPTASGGPVRDFYSPPLTPGSRYTYHVKASWKENSHEVTQAQEVGVTAGAHVTVSFPVPPGTAG